MSAPFSQRYNSRLSDKLISEIHKGLSSIEVGYCNYILTLFLLIRTIFVFNLLYYSTKSLLLGMKCVSKHQDSQICVLKLNKYE